MYFHLNVECLYRPIILNELVDLFLPMAVSSLMQMLGGFGFGVPELEVEGKEEEGQIRKVGEILVEGKEVISHNILNLLNKKVTVSRMLLRRKHSFMNKGGICSVIK